MKSKRILLVEDYPDHAAAACALLRGVGYEVAHCARGEEALEVARRFAPDLVLMDINLPGMDGMAVTRLLRSQRDTAGIPVLAVTAYALPAERERILAAGCVDVVTKPFEVRAFLATIANYLTAPPASLRQPAS